MKRYFLMILLFLSIIAAGASLLVLPAERARRRLVLKNGFIYTVDGRRTVAEAVAIKDGKFIYVGSNSEVTPYIGKDTEVIDLGQRLVLPGFIDSHCHPAYGAAHELFDIMFTGLNTVEEYKQAIRDFAARHPEAKFIKGRGWKNTLFGKTGPDKKIIDEIIPSIPVALDDEGGHASWVNSLTLKLAGITMDTKSPRGGVIERDPVTGEATGTLREGAARLVADLFPDYSVEQLMQAIEAYQKMAAAFGITTAHDATVDVNGNDFNAYKNLEKENRLAMRFRASLFVDPKQGLEQVALLVAERAKNSGPLFQVNGAKVYIDGVVEGGTAYLKEPYLHLPGFRGEPRWDADKLNDMCAELDRNKFQIHVHAIGDAATAMTLDAFAYALGKNGRRDARNLITHIQLVGAQDVLRFRELGVVAVPQPYWFMKDDYYYNLQVPYLGQKRADDEYPDGQLFQGRRRGGLGERLRGHHSLRPTARDPDRHHAQLPGRHRSQGGSLARGEGDARPDDRQLHHQRSLCEFSREHDRLDRGRQDGRPGRAGQEPVPDTGGRDQPGEGHVDFLPGEKCFFSRLGEGTNG